MARAFKPTPEQQQDILVMMQEQGTFYDNQLQVWKNKMLAIYKEYNTFTQPKTAAWQTQFKVNKAFQIVNQVLPRIMAQSPKWIVTTNNESFERDFQKSNPGMDSPLTQEKLTQYAQAIQDYLTYVFDKKHLKRALRQWAKHMIIYGQAWAKVKLKYDITREQQATAVDEIGEDGQPVVKKNVVIDEKVSDEYVTIEVKKWEDVKFDPRYVDQDDMPAIIDVTRGLRLSQFTKDKDKYFNTDKLAEIANIPRNPDQTQDYRQRILAVTGVQNLGTAATNRFDKNNLTLSTFIGLYSLKTDDDGVDERLYEFQVINDLVVVYAAELTQSPYEEIRAFEDTETNFATGFVEQIMGLQQEMNFKKNSASTYINQALNRNWVWSPQSGIDPRMLTSAPGNIIVTTKGGEDALKNCYELPFRQLTPDYFQEENDFERQIQGLTFTVDTSNQQNNQALTNTATGIRVKAFESNSVMEEIRNHFEEGIQNIGYKLLQETFEQVEGNMLIKKADGTGYWDINVEALRNAVDRYSIKIDVGSSSYDTLDAKRDDAITQRNLSSQAAQMGVPVDLQYVYKNLMETFEGVDPNKYIKQPNPMEMLQQGAGGQPPPQGGVSPLPMGNKSTPQGNSAAALTQQVAGGKVPGM